MKLAVIGGGGFRIPLLVKALAESPFEIHLFDDDPARLQVIRSVLTGVDAPTPRFHASLETALQDADFVFTTIRVGGAAGRADDERIAASHGFLGQETVGFGGMAYAMRTIPVARELAREIAAHAPDAWTINFTNPAGIVTRAMREALGDRVVGICDTPISLVNRVAGTRPVDSIDYVGLNHLGWLRSVTSAGTDLVRDLLDDADSLARLEEATVFGPELLQSIGALPNEYLFYYWFTREAIQRIAARSGRGAYLAEQQSRFYAASLAEPHRAHALWLAALAEREETYGAEARENANSRRTAAEIAGGGYQEVALTLMSALAGGTPALTISNVRNNLSGNRAIEQLPDDAVVEVPCHVDSTGIHSLPLEPVSAEMAGPMLQITASDEFLLESTATQNPHLALRALAAHPLIDSAGAAREALRELCLANPAIARAIGWPDPSR